VPWSRLGRKGREALADIFGGRGEEGGKVGECSKERGREYAIRCIEGRS